MLGGKRWNTTQIYLETIRVQLEGKATVGNKENNISEVALSQIGQLRICTRVMPRSAFILLIVDALPLSGLLPIITSQ